MSNALSPGFKSSVFRIDHANLFASNFHLATVKPILLAYDSAGYNAGVLLARNSVSGAYQKYNPSGSSGTDTAVCLAADNITDLAASETVLGRGVFGGEVYDALVVDVTGTAADSGALTDLGARRFTEANGTVIFKF